MTVNALYFADLGKPVPDAFRETILAKSELHPANCGSRDNPFLRIKEEHMNKLDYREWAADFVMATETLRRDGYSWEDLGKILDAKAEAVRALYRRAKARLS
jgi:hypothetical protein